MMFSQGTATDYKRHLEVFFDYISNNGDIEAGCQQICRHASSVLIRIKRQKDNNNWSLVLGPWILPVNCADDNFCNRTACIFIDGLIDVKDSKFEKFSFSVGILLNPANDTDDFRNCCDNLNAESYRVARLFRFEVEKGNVKTSKPCSHMHYGGKVHGWLSSKAYHSCLADGIEKPRIPIPPFDLVLLFDLFLRQFNLGINRKLFKENFWVSRIQKSEQLILKQYYTSIVKHLSCMHAENRKDTLLEHLCSNL